MVHSDEILGVGQIVRRLPSPLLRSRDRGTNVGVTEAGCAWRGRDAWLLGLQCVD
jgi:hypothetical protein